MTSGLRLDRSGLLDSPSAMARVPLFLLVLLLIRGLPALLYISTIGHRSALAAALLQATSLPFLDAATQIGMDLGELSAGNGAALVMAGLLSVLVFPPIALGIMRRAPTAEPANPTVPSAGTSGSAAHEHR
ncbi:MAG: hypothetical protein ACRDP9_26925 [Kribbellaceae bacterium]